MNFKLKVVIALVTFSLLTPFGTNTSWAEDFQQLETDHGIIFYKTNVPQERASLFARDYEIAYKVVGDQLGVQYPRKIKIYIFANYDDYEDALINIAGQSKE